VSTEARFIAALRAIATSPAARGLADDAAVLDLAGSRLVLTMDAIVEGVHFLPQDPADTVAWKLVTTNVSDLAAKGAVPRGCLLTYPLAADGAWDTVFLAGLEAACHAFSIPLLGGDTVRQPARSARSLALVALGEPVAGVPVPSRTGARLGDAIWVSSTLGDAGLGLGLLRGEHHAEQDHFDTLVASYRQPRPQVSLGVALAPYVTAMMDVSDGLLIDIDRLAGASQVAAVVDLDRVPLSPAFEAVAGDDQEARLFAASAGDDYCLLLTAPIELSDVLRQAAARHGAVLHQVGRIKAGQGLTVCAHGAPIRLPDRLGYEH
jgi:thiamine-monophosphate kinase